MALTKRYNVSWIYNYQGVWSDVTSLSYSVVLKYASADLERDVMIVCIFGPAGSSLEFMSSVVLTSMDVTT